MKEQKTGNDYMPLKLAITTEFSKINILNSFIYSDKKEFQAALREVVSQAKPLHINLADTTFMDSSGIGMLLVAQKTCADKNIDLVLEKPTGDVKSLLQMTQCYDRFTIRD